MLIGVTGPPGAGKTTFASTLAERLRPRAAVVSMDGYHLANAELIRLGRRERKGAIDTFDADGFASIIERLAAATEDITYVPSFDRRIEEPIAGAIPIPREIPIVVVEGNYLLADVPPWSRAAQLLTECWYLDLDEETRLRRLQARHVQFGDDAATARRRAYGSDQRNAVFIKESQARADLVIDMTAL